MATNRIRFALLDLEQSIQALARADEIELVLPFAAFGPVANEIASQFGVPLSNGADRFRLGSIMVRRGPPPTVDKE